jgi:endonuclease/exonuclease/phosphatase family metal-dependent hydrolase
MKTTHYAAFWNLENLFDIENSPRRSDKLARTLAKELKGWNQAALDRKLSQLAGIIMKFNGGRGPDILCVCEVENRCVLEQLRGVIAALGRQYGIAHADTLDERGIDVAFFFDQSRYTAENVFSHFLIKRVATRDIVQVNLRTTEGHLLVVVGCHWPSRTGGQLESEPYRMLAGETLAYFHERIREVHGPETAILVMGDFNDEPFSRSLVQYALSERQRARVTRARTGRLWNLMWPLLGQARGTHYFENTANVLDQVLVSKSLATGASGFRVVDDSVRIEAFPEMTGAGDYPGPIRYGRGSALNQNGFSDHFPVSVTIREG